MLKILAMCAALCCVTSMANASQCVPIEEYDALIESSGVPRSAIVAKRGADFVISYNDALGFSIPADSKPIGMFFIIGPVVVLAAIVEDGGCVKYATRIPLWKHQRALTGA